MHVLCQLLACLFLCAAQTLLGELAVLLWKHLSDAGAGADRITGLCPAHSLEQERRRPAGEDAPWTCAHSDCVPSRSACRRSHRRTPGPPPPCAWSCDTWARPAGGIGSRTPRTWNTHRRSERRSETPSPAQRLILTAAVWLRSDASDAPTDASSAWTSDRTRHRCSSSPLPTAQYSPLAITHRCNPGCSFNLA